MRLLLLLVLCCHLSALPALEVLSDAAGGLHLDGIGDLNPGLFDANWQSRGAVTHGVPTGDVRSFDIAYPGGGTVHGSATFTLQDGGIACRYVLTADRALACNALMVSLGLPVAEAGSTWTTTNGPGETRTGQLPVNAAPEPHLFTASVRTLDIAFTSGHVLNLAFATPTTVLLQDDRRWSPGFSLRIGPQPVQLAAGVPVEIAFTLRAGPGLTLAHDHPVTVTAGPGWIPLKHELDVEPGSALDWSGMGFTEAPAGRHGRVVAHGGDFAFADTPDKAQRFYGVNLCFTAQYLEHDLAERLATRLQRAGYNTVRIHHYERELTGSKPGFDWSPAKIDQLDFLTAALLDKGIYLTTDLYVSRPVEGSANPKVLIPVDEAAFQDWRTFTLKFLGHVNPYTKRRYADEPGLAWLVMINEGNLGNYWKEIRATAQWGAAWTRWRAAHALPERPFPDDEADAEVATFLADTERASFTRMAAVVRDELGCHALLTNTNGWTNRVSDQAPRQDYDYIDDHFYVDHPQFLEQDWRLPSRCDNRNPVNASPGGTHNAFVREWGKPFTVSEFNYASPGRYRAVGGMLTGALGALQGWSSIWRFAYSHAHDSVAAVQRMNYFDIASDPLNTAAERAAILLFLRGDLAPATRRLTMTLPVVTSGRMPNLAPGWMWTAWKAQVGTPGPAGALGTSLPRDASDEQARAALGADIPTGLTIDVPKGAFTIDTPRLAGGFAEAGGTIVAPGAGLRVDQLDQAASVTIAALDGQPLRGSGRLLLTHLTDVQNSGARYAEMARRTLLDWGGLPHLAAAGSARVSFTTTRALEVWSLTMAGTRVARIPAQLADGRLTFTVAIAGDAAHLYYELTASPGR